MKRKVAVFAGIMFVLIVLWWVIQWLANGGWPSSGPVGATLPPHIQYVKPADGEMVKESHGFCIHFYYPAGNGMGENSRETIRYFFNGVNVKKGIFEVVELEYPVSVGEPCYMRTEPLAPGWHTVKVMYVDSAGQEFDYTWRFQVLDER